ncbi:MAG TPA: hypothetical protein VHA33_12970 [Candidatus Angelobacter sp.]|jgi:hypothetical protein|nr:hypothetical protein [Candidatus Angelobacter sp.]
MAANQQFENEATLVAVTVVALGQTLFQSKVETIISKLHFLMLHPVMQWWPLLLIVAGVVLLVKDRLGTTHAHETTRREVTNEQRGEQ